MRGARLHGSEAFHSRHNSAQNHGNASVGQRYQYERNNQHQDESHVRHDVIQTSVVAGQAVHRGVVTVEALHSHRPAEGEAIDQANAGRYEGQHAQPCRQQQGGDGRRRHHAVVVQREANGHESVEGHDDERPGLHAQEEEDKEHVAQAGLVDDGVPAKQEAVQQLGDESRAAAQIHQRQVAHDHVFGRVEALGQVNDGQEQAVAHHGQDVDKAQEHVVVANVGDVDEAGEVEAFGANEGGIEGSSGSFFLLLVHHERLLPGIQGSRRVTPQKHLRCGLYENVSLHDCKSAASHGH